MRLNYYTFPRDLKASDLTFEELKEFGLADKGWVVNYYDPFADEDRKKYFNTDDNISEKEVIRAFEENSEFLAGLYYRRVRHLEFKSIERIDWVASEEQINEFLERKHCWSVSKIVEFIERFGGNGRTEIYDGDGNFQKACDINV